MTRKQLITRLLALGNDDTEVLLDGVEVQSVCVATFVDGSHEHINISELDTYWGDVIDTEGVTVTPDSHLLPEGE